MKNNKMSNNVASLQVINPEHNDKLLKSMKDTIESCGLGVVNDYTFDGFSCQLNSGMKYEFSECEFFDNMGRHVGVISANSSKTIIPGEDVFSLAVIMHSSLHKKDDIASINTMAIFDENIKNNIKPTFSIKKLGGGITKVSTYCSLNKDFNTFSRTQVLNMIADLNPNSCLMVIDKINTGTLMH